MSACLITSEYHWLKSSLAEQIESDACVAAPFCTFCCFFCCCFFFFGFCCDSVADQTGAVRRNVDTAGRKNALAARSESIVNTARRIDDCLRASTCDGSQRCLTWDPSLHT